MFQFAIGKSLAIKLNTSLYFDNSFYELGKETSVTRPYELDLFNFPVKFAKKNEIDAFLTPSKFQRCLNKLGFFEKTYFKENSFLFDPKINTFNSSAYLHGYWQSEKYFAPFSDAIRQEFNFTKSFNLQSEKLKQEILQKENSVSVHVRRGDYISSPQNIQIHGTCTLDYYKEAISLIRKEVENPFFYFFSDDPDWVEGNLTVTTKNYCLIKHNVTLDNWQDMALMSKCKHNIIANSSFSWWGAWLNEHENKIVIAPMKWFADADLNCQSDSIVPESWIKI